MCVVSMVMDHYGDKWNKRLNEQGPFQDLPTWTPSVVLPSQSEIDEFRSLLQRAREYDKRHNEPNCELAEKKAKILDLAKQLGVDVSFVNQEPL